MHPDFQVKQIPMEPDEVSFLKARRDEELPLLFKSIRFFAVLCVFVVIVLGVCMYLLRKYSGEIVRPMNVPTPNILMTCLSALLGLFVFVGSAITVSVKHLRRLSEILKKETNLLSHAPQFEKFI